VGLKQTLLKKKTIYRVTVTEKKKIMVINKTNTKLFSIHQLASN
jgi:hypothetical protein